MISLNENELHKNNESHKRATQFKCVRKQLLFETYIHITGLFSKKLQTYSSEFMHIKESK